VLRQQEKRLQALARSLAGYATNRETAQLLGLSVRHVRRLKGALARGGPAALVHGNKGRRPTHRLPDDLRARLVELATTTYAGNSHQRLCLLLAEHEQLTVSRSTLRRILLSAGVRSPNSHRPRRLPPGTMPIGFDLVQRRVELLELRGADYREPSFHQTVERWRRERPDAPSFELDLEAFASAARLEPGRPPDGFVFSVGRCGSTVLANMLSRADEHLVIKEAPAVNALLAALLNAPDEARAEREALLELTLPFMFRPTRGTERWLVFTLTSWNARLAGLLLQLFPITQAAFLHRPPEAVVASMLARPPGWHSWLDRTRQAQARLFPTLAAVPAQAALSATAFYAHAWRSAVEAALALPHRRLLVIDYDRLMEEPMPTLMRLQAHFGLAVAPEFLPASRIVHKAPPESPAAGAAHESAAAQHQLVLGPDQESEVLSVVGDLPGRLASRQAHGMEMR
jgi:transposase